MINSQPTVESIERLLIDNNFKLIDGLVLALLSVSRKYQRRLNDAASLTSSAQEALLRETYLHLIKNRLPAGQKYLLPITRLAVLGWSQGQSTHKLRIAYRKARENIGLRRNPTGKRQNSKGRAINYANDYLLKALCGCYFQFFGKRPPSGYDDIKSQYVGEGFKFILATFQHITQRHIDPNTLGRYLADEKARLSLIIKEII
jgi:hypothetical protein